MRLSGFNVPLERLSPSSISLFVSCPEQFRQKYLLGKPEKFFGDAFMGSVNHETVAEVLRLKKLQAAGSDNTDPDVRKIFRDMWQARLDDEGEPDWKEDDPGEMYARGLLMAAAYVEEVVPKINPVAIEERVEMTIPGLPKIIGYVDVIERDKIRERKTAAAKVTKPKSRWRFQGRVYQLIVGLPVEWDVVTRQVTPKIYTAEEFPELRLDMVSAKATTEMIRDAAERMSDLYLRRGADNPWPTDGYWGMWECDRCAIGPQYASTCVAWA